MRIIAGTKRGMKLASPQGLQSRPILDRVKESLFNILFSRYGMPEGKVIADLFCGVGSLGLEALSRGAKFVTFVDKDLETLDILQQNIAKAGFTSQSNLISADAFRTGAAVNPEIGKYQLVFVDPPYAMMDETSERSLLSGLMNILAEQTDKEAVVVVRIPREVKLLERYGCFEAINRREWGTTAITFFTRKENDK
jgi:16S rRNA (guanine966-N2)-methyltransferase